MSESKSRTKGVIGLMKDKIGRTLNQWDKIVWTVKHSTSAELRYGQVFEVQPERVYVVPHDKSYWSKKPRKPVWLTRSDRIMFVGPYAF